MFHIHKWSNWSDPKPGEATDYRGWTYAITIQSRDCSRCNKRELRRVTS